MYSFLNISEYIHILVSLNYYRKKNTNFFYTKIYQIMRYSIIFLPEKLNQERYISQLMYSQWTETNAAIRQTCSSPSREHTSYISSVLPFCDPISFPSSRNDTQLLIEAEILTVICKVLIQYTHTVIRKCLGINYFITSFRPLMSVTA